MSLLGRRTTKIVGFVALASVLVLVYLGLWASPPDVNQSDGVRLLYLHVPSAWLAYLAFFVTSIASALYLWPRTRSLVWDLLAGASAEVGVLFTGLTLVLGSLWGKPVWGVWWAWDARLVTTAVLFFLYLGYLALRRIPGGAEARGKRSAIVALIAFIDVPIVHFSVNWWRTLHQEGSIFNDEMKAHIHGLMAFTLVWGVIAFTVLYVYLLSIRYRLAAIEEEMEDRELEQAIAERIDRDRPVAEVTAP
ncbi:MAG: cytochrome c biogenesis protein CcsA [Acidimicrobiia bacterium]